MSVIASGISKLLLFKKQSGLGAIASGSAQSLRRTMSTLDKKKATYQSKEILPSQQRRDFRHGVVGTDGTISGELSVGTYQSFLESICRQVSLSAVTAAFADLVFAVGTPASLGTITTTSGNFLTSGYKVGMVVRATGVLIATSLNSTNFLITSINATGKVMGFATLNGSSVVARTETASVTLASIGKHTFIPQTGHTRDYYTVEHNFADIVQSEVFTDTVVSQVDVKLPPTGMATIDFVMKGIDMKTNTQTVNPIATPYFTGNTPITTGSVLAAANGVLFLAGVPIALVTGLNFSIKGNHTMIGGVVGSNVEPDIFPGDVTVDGQATVLFQDGVIRDIFLNETEVTLVGVFTADNTPASSFMGFTMNRVKMGGASKDDGEKGLVLTMPFTALEYNGGAGKDGFQTTIVIQDSSFV